MTEKATEIEVEVVEIDGLAPVAPQTRTGESSPTHGDWQDWRQWQGRVRQLDSRWWPLWVLLGVIALTLFLTLGLLLLVVFGIIRLVLKLIRAIFG